MIEEEFVDDGGPLYYEADQKPEEPEVEFNDDGGPLYYEAEGEIDRPPAIPEDEPPEEFPPAPQE